MEPSKQERYVALVADRKKCHDCLDLTNPSDLDIGFDSEQIGPWTRLDGDLDARLMVVGQDWGDVDYYRRYEGFDKDKDPATNATNQNLEQLLKVAHADDFAAPLSFSAKPRGLFLTNAILCLKEGGMQAKVQQACFDNCGPKFLRKQIEIVRPAVVAAMGRLAYGATLAAFGLRPPPKVLRDAVEDQCGTPLLTGVTLLAVYHCGPRVINTHRDMEQQRRDWKRVARALSLSRHPRHPGRPSPP